MKILYLICVLLVGFGCSQQPPANSSMKQELPPPIPEKKPEQPVRPSSAYVKGYLDGYYGTWLGPFKWAFMDDYRNGWSAGAYDRQHGLPNQHEQKA